MKVTIHGRNIDVKHARQLASIFQFMERKGVVLCIYKPFRLFIEKELLINCSNYLTYDDEDGLPIDVKFMLSIGGDGTFLDAARFIKDKGVPIIGINLGRLGFLAYVSVADSIGALEQLVSGSYTLEQRSLLSVSGACFNSDHSSFALNEVTVQRKGSSLIEIEVKIDGMLLSSYWSDGLIIATPTGSTAYSMSVGGPIVSPDSANLIISPIAPHNLSIRSIVIPDSSIISVKVNTRKDSAMITLDNQMFDIESGTEFTVQKSTFTIQLVKLSDSNFYKTLRNKLFWGLDPRS